MNMEHPTQNSLSTTNSALRNIHAGVLSNRKLSPESYELTLERKGLAFRAGQLLNVTVDALLEERSYTVCSGEQDENLQILYKVIPDGILTPKLAALSSGDTLLMSGPYGEFTVRDIGRPLVFIATGTGIAPARSYLRSHPELEMTVVHGVSHYRELYYREELEEKTTYIPCVSRESGDGFHGRVTEWCREHTFAPDSHFYLCGANEMFYDVAEILAKQGYAIDRIFTEAYYYRYDQ